jgi:hypothetical protein
VGKVDGNTTDNGDDMWDEVPPELLPSVFSSRKKKQMRKRTPKGTPPATAAAGFSSAAAPNKRRKLAHPRLKGVGSRRVSEYERVIYCCFIFL